MLKVLVGTLIANEESSDGRYEDESRGEEVDESCLVVAGETVRLTVTTEDEEMEGALESFEE